MLFICQSLGLDGKKIDKCMGDPKANSDNPVLKEEQDAQVIVVLFFILQLSMTFYGTVWERGPTSVPKKYEFFFCLKLIFF
jgi:hypothetical protein